MEGAIEAVTSMTMGILIGNHSFTPNYVASRIFGMLTEHAHELRSMGVWAEYFSSFGGGTLVADLVQVLVNS